MVINSNKRLREIQQEFAAAFPYLRIQFYASPHSVGEGSSIKEQISDEHPLHEVQRKVGKGNFTIDANMTVGDFEKRFSEQFGISVQVFRKSGSMWMQTTSTDGWTLAEQNRKGGSSEEAFIEKYGS